RFPPLVAERAKALASTAPARPGPGVELRPLEPRYREDGTDYRHVTLDVDAAARVARLTVRGPEAEEPASPAAMRERGSDLWALRAFRELDDALLELRFNRPAIGVVVLQTRGDAAQVLAADAAPL